MCTAPDFEQIANAAAAYVRRSTATADSVVELVYAIADDDGNHMGEMRNRLCVEQQQEQLLPPEVQADMLQASEVPESEIPAALEQARATWADGYRQGLAAVVRDTIRRTTLEPHRGDDGRCLRVVDVGLEIDGVTMPRNEV